MNHVVTEKERMEQIKKAKYFDEAKESREAGNPFGVYTPGMLMALYDMAKNDIWPDWRFSDATCNIWSLFHVK